MRRPPDLVFLNCCHLASVDSEIVRRTGDGTPSAGPPAGELLNQRLKRPQLAASLSRTLMAMGVRAVVAAGWAVDDRAASEFAKAFYDRMLDGESFGPAVRSARIAAHQSDGGASNTWAAYQCYGDPGFRISTSTCRYTTPSIPVSADELVRAVEALAVKAGDAGIEIETVREELRRLERIAQVELGRARRHPRRPRASLERVRRSRRRRAAVPQGAGRRGRRRADQRDRAARQPRDAAGGRGRRRRGHHRRRRVDGDTADRSRRVVASRSSVPCRPPPSDGRSAPACGRRSPSAPAAASARPP